ncbi:MAG: hypothetical protein KY469_03545 [Actinobacteria bacterium]|nr:hypothetical protein [Actinomycetota bacterium]
MTPSRLTTATLTSALLLSACGGGDADVSRFQDDLDAQAQAQTALRDRIADLEAALGAVGNDDEQVLAGLDERLTALETTLSDLTTRLDEERTAREDGDAEQLAALSNLESVLQTVQTTLDTLRAELQQLADDHALLRTQFENHVEDHGG